MKCKECLIDKELSEFYKHPQSKSGVLGRCKECIKAGRRTERERSMARIIDKKRIRPKGYQTNMCRKFRKENPLKYEAHKKVNNYFRNNSKPETCLNCLSKENIELHHHDYNYPNEITPLCSLCHKQHHYGKIDISHLDIIKLPF